MTTSNVEIQAIPTQKTILQSKKSLLSKRALRTTEVLRSQMKEEGGYVEIKTETDDYVLVQTTTARIGIVSPPSTSLGARIITSKFAAIATLPALSLK